MMVRDITRSGYIMFLDQVEEEISISLSTSSPVIEWSLVSRFPEYFNYVSRING